MSRVTIFLQTLQDLVLHGDVGLDLHRAGVEGHAVVAGRLVGHGAGGVRLGLGGAVGLPVVALDHAQELAQLVAVGVRQGRGLLLRHGEGAAERLLVESIVVAAQ